MRARTYVLVLIAVATTLFLSVVATNLVLDPQGFYRGGGPELWASRNDRYVRFKAYQSEAGAYEGLMFGSSRGLAFPLARLSQLTGGIRFANFAVRGGMIADYLPVLEYVLRDKAAKGQRLRHVFLLLDVDTLGWVPRTNQTPQYAWPPEVTGENRIRFWWKNLTAIQLDAWKDRWRARHSTAWLNGVANAFADLSLAGSANAQAVVLARPQSPPSRELVSTARWFPKQMAMIEQFVALCRANDIALTIAISPMRLDMMKVDENDVEGIIGRLARIAPLWDFHTQRGVVDRPEFWLDDSHFLPGFASMMLDRIFLPDPASAAATIGVLRGL